MDVSSTEIEDSISNYRHTEDLSELIGAQNWSRNY